MSTWGHEVYTGDQTLIVLRSMLSSFLPAQAFTTPVDRVVHLDYHLVTLKVWLEASSLGNECQRYLLYHLVLFLSIMKDMTGKIDGKLVFLILLHEG